MAFKILPQFSTTTQQVSTQQFIIQALTDLAAANLSLAADIDHTTRRVEDALAIQRGQMIEGKVRNGR